MRIEQEYNPELQERLRQVRTLVFDVDQCLSPGPVELDSVLDQLASQYDIIPCTSRSYGEMEAESYPGKDVLLSSPNGIFEAGLVIKKNGDARPSCDPAALEKLIEIKSRLQSEFIPIGSRSKADKYQFINEPADPNSYGTFPKIQGSTNPLPFTFSNYQGQLSLIMWPSGTARECPLGFNYFACAEYVESMREKDQQLFENVSILRTDGSVLIRPNGPRGRPITKLRGVQQLENQKILKPSTTLFLGDDEQMDLAVAEYVKENGGFVITPDNAADQMKKAADMILPGNAGVAVLPFLQMLLKL